MDCPVDCDGCRCHIRPPCHHCVEHLYEEGELRKCAFCRTIARCEEAKVKELNVSFWLCGLCLHEHLAKTESPSQRRKRLAKEKRAAAAAFDFDSIIGELEGL